MNVKKVVEIIGPRQSGKSTLLKDMWFEELTNDKNKTFVFIGTDIRARETINHIWNDSHFTSVYIISPLGDTIKHYHRHRVTSYLREEGIRKLTSEVDIRLFIDNITLDKTEKLVRDISPYLDVEKLHYTGLTFYSGKNRKLIKEVFKVGDLNKIDFESIKLVREGE